MIRILTLTLALLWASPVWADQLAVEPDSAPIGSPIRLTLTIDLQKGEKAVPPSGIKLPDGAELIAVHPPKTAPNPDGGETVSQTYEILMWTLGETEIPEIEYAVMAPDGMEGKRQAGPVKINIVSVRTDKATADKPKDIRPPVKVELRWGDYAWALLGLITLAVIAYLLYRRWKNRPRKPMSAPFVPPQPPRPPYDIAIEKLEELGREDLFGQERGRDFFFRLSEILREYVEGRFDLPALERTTAEIEREPRLERIPHLARNAFIAILRECDMVKFAKAEPVKSHADSAIEKALAIVESTRPLPPAPNVSAQK